MSTRGTKNPCLAIVTKFVSFRYVPTGNFYNTKTKLYFLYEWWEFALLQSTLHQLWAAWRCGTLGATTINYATSSALETWPMPASSQTGTEIDLLGERYHSLREKLMHEMGVGLTGLYNDFHDPDCTRSGIAALRQLHIELDLACLAVYDWLDVSPDFGFRNTG